MYVLNRNRQILSYGRGYPHADARKYESSGQLESGPGSDPRQLFTDVPVGSIYS